MLDSADQLVHLVEHHATLGHLGGGLAQDDAVFGTTFLVLVVVGGACFGWIASLHFFERWSLPTLDQLRKPAKPWHQRFNGLDLPRLMNEFQQQIEKGKSER